MLRGAYLPVVASLLMCASVSLGGTINVPVDQPTIQDAINVAVDGDQVLVAPGVYNETINFVGKAIVVKSTGGSDVTTIDGTGFNASVVTCASDEGPSTRLDGFTVTGGNSSGDGGGMQNSDSNPTVTDCVFIGNTGFNGGGMSNSGNSPSGEGPTVIGCRFEGNTSTNTGGGMHNGSSDSTIIGCQFIGNVGSGMFNAGANPTVTNCLFTGNDANQGGGLMSTSGAFVTLTNCTIAGNTAVSSGAGINGGGFSITNCIISGNNSPSTPNINGSPTVSYSLVDGGFVGTGNIGSAPNFVNAGGGDYRLQPGSPGIDAGNNGALAPCALDLDNAARFFDDPASPDTGFGSAPIIDMGAYETGGPIDSDCDKDALGDTCAVVEELVEDCNLNSVPDGCDIALGTSADVDFSGRPDECEDCNTNGILDSVDIASGTSHDGNQNALPDECEFIDCNVNGTHDADDIAAQASPDCNGDFVPDECQLDPTLLLYGVVRDGPSLYIGDPSNATLNNVATMNDNVYRAYGLSTEPGTEQLHAVIQRLGDVTRQLATVNRDTGAVSVIGSLSEPIADIAFRDNGTLYAIAGNNATTPGQVFVVLLGDASLIPVGIIAGDGGGHSIAFRSNTDHLYHVYGERLEFINVNSGAITSVTQNLNPFEVNAMTFDVASDRILAYSRNLLFEIDPDNGSSAFLGSSQNVGTVTGLAQLLSANDCNQNTIPDTCDIEVGFSLDTNQNGRADECELVDCNLNGVHDADDLSGGGSLDCNADNIPDECAVDCNANTVPDDCDIAFGASNDCNGNAIPDECEDCDGNGVADECDLAAGDSIDCDSNGIPDSCDVASNQFTEFSPNLSPINNVSTQSYTLSAPRLAFSDVVLDFTASADLGSSTEFITVDLNGIDVGTVFVDAALGDCPGLPEPAQLVVPAAVFNAALARGLLTITMVASANVNENDADCTAPSFVTVSVAYDGPADCNANAIPDSCDVVEGGSLDCNANNVPDECESDCNTNGVPDACDITTGFSIDANVNGLPDECEFIDCNTNGIDDAEDLSSLTSADCNADFIPDECQLSSPATIYGVDRNGPSLFILNDSDASLTTAATMDQGVSQTYGLAAHPVTGQLFAIVSQGGGGGGPRLLATVNRDTGAVAIIAPFSEPVSDISFRGNGMLYAISGNSASNAGEIHFVSLADATLTSTGIVRGNGGGQSIAFQPDTDRLYHAFNDQLEYIDANTGGVTSVNVALGFSGINAMTFEHSGGQLIASSFGDVFRIDPDTGAPQFINSTPAFLTGLVSLIPTNDCNGNSVPDECESDCNGNGTIDACDPFTPGDFDADGDVDTDDYQNLADCYSGPGQTPNPLTAGCVDICLSVFDQDADGDIDLRDFAEFANLLNAILP
ncbi:MAG: hypothetical protein GXP29_11295 [Planctomycetes bacterium]|nr:hypothetical protein [Planctomycetota bacterium]